MGGPSFTLLEAPLQRPWDGVADVLSNIGVVQVVHLLALSRSFKSRKGKQVIWNDDHCLVARRSAAGAWQVAVQGKLEITLASREDLVHQMSKKE